MPSLWLRQHQADMELAIGRAMTSAVSQKPSDPIAFIAESLRQAAERQPSVQRTMWQKVLPRTRR